MYLYHLLFASLISLIECTPLPSDSSNLLRSLDLPVDATGATAFSLLYGTPLINFLQIANQTLLYGGSNVLFSHNTTATAATHTVVRPNVDTVYAEAIFDLSATDLVLTLPAMEEDRFYLAAFFDPSVIPQLLCVHYYSRSISEGLKHLRPNILQQLRRQLRLSRQRAV